MHGLIFAELKKFVDTRLGSDAWPGLLQQAGLTGKIYAPVREYPDGEAVALVTAASATTKLPAAAILEDFGEFIVPDLLQLYGALLDPHWKTLEVIENTENTIHRVVRMKNPGALPPELMVRRTGEDRVVITYRSARRMCAVAKGIAKGFAKHFGEQVEIDEPRCMTRGDDSCEIAVRRV